MGSMESYTIDFHTGLLDCTDVDDSDAICQYISGLKTEPYNWAPMTIGNEMPMLQHAAQIAEWYDNAHYHNCQPNLPN